MVEFSALTLALGVALVFLGLVQLRSTDRAVASRLRSYGMTRPPAGRAESSSPRVSMVGPIAGHVDRALSERTFVGSIRADLARANLRLTVGEFLLFQTALTFAFMLIGYDVVAVVAQPNLIALPVFGLLGFSLPRLWVMRRISARLHSFKEQLSDVITLMANALRSGMSVLQAMDMVARESQTPACEEFGRVVQEIGLGLPPEEALRHLKRRIRSDDVDLLVTAMIVQGQVGGDLASLLDGIAEMMRQRVELQGELRTLTTQQRVSGYVLAVMPIIGAILLLLVNPDYMLPLFTMPWLLLPIMAAGSVFFGFFAIQRVIASVEL